MNRTGAMIGAEFLKLRRRRAMVLQSVVLCVGSIVLLNVLVSAYGGAPAGGKAGFSTALTMFSVVVPLAAVIVGATAGSADIGAGVFRSLVATGQSRVRIGLVRVPGALLVFLPILALGFLIEVTLAGLLANGTATPDAASIAGAAGWLTAVGALNLCVTLGLAALMNSRGTAIAVMLGWELAGAHLVAAIPGLGWWRALISTVAVDRLRPGSEDTQFLPGDAFSLTLVGAIAVVAAWIAIFTAAGVWRTARQDA